MPNKIAPLRPVLAYVIKRVLDCMNRFPVALATAVKIPEEIAPGYRLFMRGDHIRQIVDLQKMIETHVWYVAPQQQ